MHNKLCLDNDTGNFVYYNVLINNHSHIQYHTNLNHQCVALNSGRSNISRINKVNAIQNKLSKKVFSFDEDKTSSFHKFWMPQMHLPLMVSLDLPVVMRDSTPSLIR